MFDNRHVDEVEDADDVYSVEWVRSFLESNPVWLFNAELLSKLGTKASEHVSSLLLPNLKTRHRYNTGIDFKQTEWYKLFQNPMLLQPESYIARQFQRRYRLPYTVKKLLRDLICSPISGKDLLFLKYGSYF